MSYTPTSYYSQSVKDRTSEFQGLVEAASSRSAQHAGSAKQKLLNNATASPKGEFARRAQAISKDIASTTAKLQRLAQLARRKTLFDDRPVEISELTYIIKHDIAAINKQLADLQAFNKANKSSKPDRAEEHRGNVVTLLQTTLAGATTSFQDILEVRTQNMKASKDRSEQFMFSNSAAGMGPGENSVLRSRGGKQPNAAGPNGNAGADSPLYNPTRTASAMAHRSSPLNPNTSSSGLQQSTSSDGYDPKGKKSTGNSSESDFLALDMGGSNPSGTASSGDQYLQMQLLDTQQTNYMQQRSTAIESIESTISELGQIFSQLAHMVAEQRETVQRIDDNVMEVVDNTFCFAWREW
ncbi:probable syntaxin, vesicular transport protein [Melanopsichium pennsylvanicum]|uniref:Probable syntaxin, vesicular transport protein n=1 Tax=Melanopsichium pennsylvanicum TaxID=63383 RepID=A0AAJ5C2W4_9BASI|nr:probable syntaxin, vesicular transport protein [Melanopsichium pennsylvanicum]